MSWAKQTPNPASWAQQAAGRQPWAKQNAGAGVTLWDTLLDGTDWDAPAPFTIWDLSLNPVDIWDKQ
jgi:hypothetical protein